MMPTTNSYKTMFGGHGERVAFEAHIFRVEYTGCEIPTTTTTQQQKV